jgi:peptide/nickel transport system permease protein
VSRYIIRRLLWAVALFIAVTAITYVIFFMIPADPAAQACGQRATPECVASARKFFGLDKPVPVQYYNFMKRLIVHQDLGHSFTNRQDVNEIVKEAAPVTASLVFGGAVFTETVYGLPGLGRTLVQSIANFDLPVTMGLVVFTTTSIIFFTLVVDLLYAWIDPRIRLS